MKFSKAYSLLLFAAVALISSSAQNDDDGGEGMVLVGNLITRTDVSDIADMALDIRDMRAMCDVGDIDGALAVFRDGENSEFSLKQLVYSERYTNADFTFAFQMYGLSGAKPADHDQFTTFSADYVEKLFEDGKCKTAVAAAQNIALWMHIASVSWNILHSCTIRADPQFDNDAAGVGNLPNLADIIVAYWVGSLQEDSEGVDGFSLYSQTNKIGEKFGTNIIGGARANRYILDSYEQISAILSQDQACDDGYEMRRTNEDLWTPIVELTRQMMVPQMQGLIYAMLEEDMDDIGVYSQIVVPQLSQCRYSSYKYLKDTFLDNEYDTSKFHNTLKVLQSTYACLGLSCSDIGIAHEYGDRVLGCHDYSEEPILAGYPAGSDVTEIAKIDLDMHQINVLTSFENEYYWTMAKFIYKLGKNSAIDNYYDDDDASDGGYLSLHAMAIDSERKIAPFYDSYIAYFDDPHYADDSIMETFENEGRWKNKPMAQRAMAIRVTMQAQIIYMYVLYKLQKAADNCGQDDSVRMDVLDDGDNVIDEWDEAAALIIGSLEGEDLGGSSNFKDGSSLWSLANNRAVEFSRQNEEGYAISNAAIFNLLLAGKAKIISNSCSNLERFSYGIAHMLFIPLFQSTVKYAIVNHMETADSDDPDIVAGEIFAKSVIPVLQNYDYQSAKTVSDNMVPVEEFVQLVKEGPQKVADSYLAIADDFNIECEYIGKSFEVDACANYRLQYKTSNSVANSVSLVATTVCLLAVSLLI